MAEVVKKNIKKEAREEAQKEEVLLVLNTLEEEKIRQARRLNVRVTGIGEKTGSTPEKDGRELRNKLGYKEDEPPPFIKTWRAGKDPNKERASSSNFQMTSHTPPFFAKG